MSAPAAGAAAGGSGLLATTASGGQEQSSDGSCVLQSGTSHLDRVGDACGQQVLVLVGGCVQALAVRQGTNLVDHHVAGQSSIFGDLLDRGFDGTEHDRGTGCLVAFELDVVLGLGSSLDQGDTAARQQTFLDSALALRTASSMRCLRSLASTSVAAPTLMTATPPASLARRSCSFSRS